MSSKLFEVLLAGVLLIAATSINVYAAEWKYAMGEGKSDPQGIYAVAFKFLLYPKRNESLCRVGFKVYSLTLWK